MEQVDTTITKVSNKPKSDVIDFKAVYKIFIQAYVRNHANEEYVQEVKEQDHG